MLVETKAGAAGAVGAQFAANCQARRLHAADPHRRRSPASPRSTSCSAAQPKFTRADFIPIARLTAGPMVLVVNDQQPYKTLKEFVDDAKANPDKLIF